MDYDRLCEFAIDFNYISRMLEHYTNELDNLDGNELIEKIQQAIREELVEESLMRIEEFYNEYPYDENDELDKSGEPQILNENIEEELNTNEYKCLVVKSFNNLKHLKCLIHEVINDIYEKVQELLENASFETNEINEIVKAMDNLFYFE
jgi:Glu-tRNA(Gln) amidotransferase subunit E-like FAD-binding protein